MLSRWFLLLSVLVAVAVSDTTPNRFLRVESEPNYPFKDADTSEERVNGVGTGIVALEKSLSLAQVLTVVRTSGQIDTLVGQFMPIDVMVSLGLSKLSGNALKASPKFNFYETYVQKEVKFWVSEEYTPTVALLRLGLDLESKTLQAHPNFKYYDEFMTQKVDYWANSFFTADDVKILLHLDTLTDDALKNHPNFPYYEKFLLAEKATIKD